MAIERTFSRGQETVARVQRRVVVFVQGCTLGCRLCWNPETHAFSGQERTIEAVTDIVVSAYRERLFEGVVKRGRPSNCTAYRPTFRFSRSVSVSCSKDLM